MNIRSIMLLAAVSLTFLLQGCVGVRDISLQSPYLEWIGKKFILQQDCYVYSTKETKGRLFVGNASIGHFLPGEVSPKFINERFDNDDALIVGILPKGSVFTIVGCEERYSPEDTFRCYQVRFENTSFQMQVIDASDLTDMAMNPPVFRASLAKPIN